jgi:hypothetical protein
MDVDEWSATRHNPGNRDKLRTKVKRALSGFSEILRPCYNRSMHLQDYSPRPAHLRWLLDSDPAIRWQVPGHLYGTTVKNFLINIVQGGGVFEVTP